ncbi:MAG: hypothetical protein U1E95_08590 [Rubrivivax sp.]
MDEVVPGRRSVALSAAPLLGALAARRARRPILLGPDAEAEPWVRAAAQAQARARHLPQAAARRPPGQRRAAAAGLRRPRRGAGRRRPAPAARWSPPRGPCARGAAAVDVAVTHALFVGDAGPVLARAGIRRVWSSDTVPHPSNAVSVAPLLAAALRDL